MNLSPMPKILKTSNQIIIKRNPSQNKLFWDKNKVLVFQPLTNPTKR
jgi:hypothetical protein